MRQKRVLLVLNSDLIAAGVPNVVMTIVRNLHEQVLFDIVTYHTIEGKYDTEFRSYGGEIFNLSLLDYSHHKLLFVYRYRQIELFMNSLLKNKNYDIIHCHNGIESGVFLKVANKHKIPVRISQAHGTYNRSGKNKILLLYNKLCKKMIMKYATNRLSCSRFAGNSLFLDKEYDNILNPIDVRYYQTVKKQKHDGIIFLQIGYFCNNKNQLFSIELFDCLKKIYPESELIFVGFEQEQGYLEKMKLVIEEKNLSESISFFPSDADKIQLFSVVDYVLMPSFSEGLPLVALESQVTQTPIIISNRVCEDANIGLAFFAEYNNVEEWVSVIQTLASNDTRYSYEVNSNMVDELQWCKHIMEIYNG